MEVVEDCGVSEVEKMRRRAEERCVELELEIENRKSEYEAVEVKFRALEGEKRVIEEEIKALKRESNGGEDEKKKLENGMEVMVDLNDDDVEEGAVFELMLENKVLECEKKYAEREVGVWKEKFEELKLWHDLNDDYVEEGAVFELMLENKVLECEKKYAEREVGVWKEKFEELKLWHDPNDDDVEEGGVFELMLENKVLECEKKYAESEVGVWKEKFEELKLDKDLVLKGGECPLMLTRDSVEASRRTQPTEMIDGMESSRSKDVAVNVAGKGITHLQTAGTPPNVTCYELCNGGKEEMRSGREYGNVSQARKQLEFKEDMSPCKKMAPPTPGGGRASSPIKISDSEDELTIADYQKVFPTENQGIRKIYISSDGTKSYNEEVIPFSTPKRKRASNVVTSDSESSDDNIPIAALKRINHWKKIHDQIGSDLNGSIETATACLVGDVSVTSPKRRLVRLRKCGGRGQAQRDSSQTSETENDRRSNKDVEEDEPEEVESDSEGESLGGFIVNSASDVSESNDACSESNSVSDDDVNYKDVISRKKDHVTKWEFEGDMLAAFGKDSELCMKAVCALYRQQTSYEKVCRETLCYNSRGFSKFDALRGSKLAEFLTDGDPTGDLNKTVEELEKHDPEAIETCRTLVTRYSKQLFNIYKNEEDPFFNFSHLEDSSNLPA